MAFRDRLLGLFSGRGAPMPKVSPYREAGTSGTAVYGGYIVNKETHSKLFGTERYRTASDILVNVSIVAAGVRYFLNLLAKPKWTVEPVDDGPEAQEAAEFLESVKDDMVTHWARVVRRAGLYRFYGFGVQEWTAKKRDDGRIGYEDIESRPQHTIEQWSIDEGGSVLGMWQRSPQTGQMLALPRGKVIYMIDDMLTDSPEGMGWFRHLVDPAERLKTFLQLEGEGFQKDLSGVPVGRAPLAYIETLVDQGKITRAQANGMTQGLEDFISNKVKKPNTALMIDSQTFQYQTADGLAVSGAPQWGVELLTGSNSSLPVMAAAIQRITMDMARIIGVENILLGADGKGSLALSKDKSHNMYLQIDSTLSDMTETMNKDFVSPLWKLNGFDDKLKPRLRTEGVAFKDVAEITAALRDMATAGAVLAPDDPAIDELRDLLGLSHTPEVDSELMGVNAPLQDEKQEDEEVTQKRRRPFEKGFDPNQPRDEDGKWGEGGGGGGGGSESDGGGGGGGGSESDGDHEDYDSLKGQSKKQYEKYSDKLVLSSELSKDEKQGVYNYQNSSGASLINQYHRFGTVREGGQRDTSLDAQLAEDFSIGDGSKSRLYYAVRAYESQHPSEAKLKANTALLDSAISKSSTSEDLVMFRGLSGDLKHIEVGAIFKDKGFVSMTSSKRIANKFTDDNNIVAVIKVPKGSKMASMHKVTQLTTEQEYILPRNSSFKVDRVKKAGNGKTIVYMTKR